jgi:hypothetical protein
MYNDRVVIPRVIEARVRLVENEKGVMCMESQRCNSNRLVW